MKYTFWVCDLQISGSVQVLYRSKLDIFMYIFIDILLFERETKANKYSVIQTNTTSNIGIFYKPYCNFFLFFTVEIYIYGIYSGWTNFAWDTTVNISTIHTNAENISTIRTTAVNIYTIHKPPKTYLPFINRLKHIYHS